MIRTTVRLDENLFKEARKKAIDERKTFTSLVNSALRVYLGKAEPKKEKKISGTEFLQRLAQYKMKGGPKDLARNHDKYTWE